LTKEEIIQLALEKSPEAPLSLRTINSLSKEDEFISGSKIIVMFGSISNFQRACGFEVADRSDLGDLTKEEIIQLALEKNPEAPLSSRTIDLSSRDGEFPSPRRIKDMFGSILNFQRECGFEVADRSNLDNLTKEEIIQLALEKSPEAPLSRPSIHGLSRNNEFPSTTKIKNMFGSISNFQRECGFEVADRSNLDNLTKEEIIQLALEKSPEAPLSLRTINSLSKEGEFISNKKIKDMFGSISNFQRECGFDRV
ncbi:MAG: hypothetical protein WCJ36_02645, partial [Candidatus Saccharibacteria bacterium]